jgi:hypothetical protein
MTNSPGEALPASAALRRTALLADFFFAGRGTAAALFAVRFGDMQKS